VLSFVANSSAVACGCDSLGCGITVLTWLVLPPPTHLFLFLRNNRILLVCLKILHLRSGHFCCATTFSSACDALSSCFLLGNDHPISSRLSMS
jgi:hypothetical protein